MSQLGYIPQKEELPTITYKNLVFEIVEITDYRIERVCVTLENDKGD
ncbi:transporter associated domain-containing protein [Gracilibacillus dipsosauri]